MRLQPGCKSFVVPLQPEKRFKTKEVCHPNIITTTIQSTRTAFADAITSITTTKVIITTTKVTNIITTTMVTTIIAIATMVIIIITTITMTV